VTLSSPLTSATSLERALAAASPRLSPPPITPASLAIHGAAAVLFVAACLCAAFASNALAWAPGFVYVFYDVALTILVLVATGRQASVPHHADAPPPTLAVVVAARNEANALPRTLRALLDQTDAPDLIIVADDGSRDDTAAVLARDFAVAPPPLGGIATSATHPTLRWLKLPHGGKARALNAALLTADVDIVLTVDADTLPAADAVGAFRAAFAADRRLVAAVAALAPICEATGLGRLLQAFQHREYARNALVFAAWARLGMLLHIPGAFAGFRRSALLAVGGFDPSGLVEDYELIHRLRRHGARHGLGWTTGMVATSATTDAPAGLATFLRQRRRWFCGFLETQLWYRDMVGSARYGRVGSLMLPLKAFDTLQPLHGLVAMALLPVLALRGHWSTLLVAAALLVVKAGFDVFVQRRAARQPINVGAGLLKALVGLVSFEILRQIGAALGWVAFLTGDRAWRPQPRSGLVAARDTDAA
jgi:cellulose synthase/poly-beta-1,6-N-acetylglucosamine synthase-like glycosyltransferase